MVFANFFDFSFSRLLLLTKWIGRGSNPQLAVYLPLQFSLPFRFVVWTLPSSVLDARRQVSTPSC